MSDSANVDDTVVRSVPVIAAAIRPRTANDPLEIARSFPRLVLEMRPDWSHSLRRFLSVIFV